jgi:hypothetical protein
MTSLFAFREAFFRPEKTVVKSVHSTTCAPASFVA